MHFLLYLISNNKYYRYKMVYIIIKNIRNEKLLLKILKIYVMKLNYLKEVLLKYIF